MARQVIKITGAQTASRHLKGVAESLSDFTMMFESIGAYYRSQLLRQFIGQGVISGGVSGKWKPLAPITIATKSTHNPMPLINMGDLMASYVMPGSPGNINIAGPMEAMFGSNYPTAKFHQGGTTMRGRPYIPARPVVLDNSALDNFTARAISSHLFRYWT